MAGTSSEHQALMAACLAGGPMAAASHLAAAAFWGAEKVRGERLEITTFDSHFHRLPGVVTHRSTLDAQKAITRHRDLPIVVPALTVVQLAECCHPYLVKSVANDLVKRNWTDFRAILQWVDTVGDRRRQALRDMCLRALEVGGHDNSPTARTLGEVLIRAGVEPFEVDYQVETPEGVLLIDYAWPEPLVGLEYNGARDHDTPLARIDDAARRCRLAALGWRMLDANRGISHDEIARWVLAALAAARRQTAR
jgi:hypothetical protein